MGVLYTHSPKSPGPFTKLPKKKFKKIQKIQKKKGLSAPCPGVNPGRRATAGRWPAMGGRPG
jgi:hypothetical protein